MRGEPRRAAVILPPDAVPPDVVPVGVGPGDSVAAASVPAGTVSVANLFLCVVRPTAWPHPVAWRQEPTVGPGADTIHLVVAGQRGVRQESLHAYDRSDLTISVMVTPSRLSSTMTTSPRATSRLLT